MRIPVLSSVRVLDITSGDAAFCGRILGDLGADVIKAEPPGGEEERALPPYAPGGDAPDAAGQQEVSLSWNFLNLNKRGITLNLGDEYGRRLFSELLGRVDVLIESSPPGAMHPRALDHEQLCSEFPELIVTSITPFGTSGPYAEFPATDLISMAMAGYVASNGYPDLPPNRLSVDQAVLLAAAEASTGTLTALMAREQSGYGQHVDVAVHDVIVELFGRAALAKWQAERTNFARQGDQAMASLGLTGRRSVFRCADGYINFQILGGVNSKFVQNLADWMRESGWTSNVTGMDWMAYEYGVLDSDELVAAEEQFEQFFLTKTSAELLRDSLQHRLMIFPISRPSDILALEPLTELGQMPRQPLGRGEDDEGIAAPGRYFFSSLLDWGEGLRAPAPGEHNQDVYGGEIGLTRDELEAARQSGVI